MGRHANRVRRVRVRQEGREEEEEGRDVAPPPHPPKRSFSLAQVHVCAPPVPPLYTPALIQCSEGEEVGWMDGRTGGE